MAQLTKAKKPSVAPKRALVLVAMLIAVVVFAIWFFSTYQQIDYVSYHPNAQMREKPFGAAMLLLQKEGNDTDYLTGVQAEAHLTDMFAMPDKTEVLIMPIHLDFLHSEALLAWVQAGGHLITYSNLWLDENDIEDGERYVKNQNPLLVMLGIEHKRLPTIKQTQDNQLLAPIDTRYTPIKLPSGEIIFVQANGYLDTQAFEQRADVSPVADYRLVYANMPTAVQKKQLFTLNAPQKQQLTTFVNDNPNHLQPQTVLVDSYVGQGRLTVLTDATLFVNPKPEEPKPKHIQVTKDQKQADDWLWQALSTDFESGRQKGNYYAGIADGDNAYLLHYLTQNAQYVWFVAHKQSSLWALLWQHMPFMMWALLVGVVAILLALPRQFGRVATLNDDSSHNFLAYFEQVGAYLWRVDALALQVANNRKQLLDKLHARLPQLVNIQDVHERCQVIAKAYQLEAHEVYLALYDSWQGETEFLAITQSFAKLSLACEGKVFPNH